MTNDERVVFECRDIGVSGTTPVHVRKTDTGYEARTGIALLGSTNMDDAGFERCGYDPFHDEFYDNFVCGTGATEAEAIESMKRDQREMANSLWSM